LLGSRGEITEENFTKKELEVLRETVKRSRQRMQREKESRAKDFEFVGLSPRATDIGISYQDYPATQKLTGEFPSSIPSSLSSLIKRTSESFRDPATSLAMTIGLGDLSKDKKGNTIVTDTYNFNAASREELNLAEVIRALTAGGSLFGGMDVLGVLAVPRDEGRPININLGKID
tara:strand:+ start:7737 stop:8261 length:525 start_codon:yes stop_codon:yes gene_type:complete